MLHTPNDKRRITRPVVKDGRVSKKGKQTVSITGMFKNPVPKANEEKKPSHIKDDNRVIAKKAALVAAMERASELAKQKREHPLTSELKGINWQSTEPHLASHRADRTRSFAVVAENYRNAVASSATSSLNRIHASLHARLDASISLSPTDPSHDHQDSQPKNDNDFNLISECIEAPGTSPPAQHVPALLASLAETDRHLNTPLATEVLGLVPRSGSSTDRTQETATVQLGKQMEAFVGLVAREEQHVQALFERRKEVIGRIGELARRMGIRMEMESEGGDDNVGVEGEAMEETVNGKEQVKEDGTSSEEQSAAVKAELTERVKDLKEEVAGVGDETLKSAKAQEKVSPFPLVLAIMQM